jgi:hypothetical protein
MPTTRGIVNFASGVADGEAFFLLFQTTFEPDLVHTNSVVPCLKVAPSGEQASPFLIVAAQVVVIPSCTPAIKRQLTNILAKTLWRLVFMPQLYGNPNLIQGMTSPQLTSYK